MFSELNFTALLGGATIIGALTAIITGGWQRIKSLFIRIYSLVFVTANLDEELSFIFASYCWANMKSSKFAIRSFGSLTQFVIPLKRFSVIAYEWLGQGSTILFRKGWRFVSVSSKDGKLSITFVRGMWKLEGLMQETVDQWNDNKQTINESIGERFYIEKIFGSFESRKGDDGGLSTDSSLKSSPTGDHSIRSGWRKFIKWKVDDISGKYGEGNGKPLEYLWLSGQAKEAVEEAVLWKKSEFWYKERKIPWKRGWLLYGKPGTGKTSLVRALGEELDMPILIFDLSTMTNYDFQLKWSKRVLNSVPCFVLFEDFDAIFDKGRNIARTEFFPGVTIDCLLQCLDGVEKSDGAFVVVTTNHIEKIDNRIAQITQSGIASRPGRIDRVIEMPSLDESGRKMLAERILSEYNDLKIKAIKEGQDDTGAQFQERCAELALQRYWEEKAKDLQEDSR